MSNPVAKEIMTSPVISLTPETPYKEAMALLTSKRVSGVPVVDEAGKLIGVISLYDILNTVQKELDGSTVEVEDEDFANAIAESGMHVDGMTNDRVSGFMSRNVITANEDTPAKEVADIMVDKRIHRVIVVDNDHKPTGIISTLDLLKLL